MKQEPMKQEQTKQEQAQISPAAPECIQEKIADASKTIFSYCMAKTLNRMDAEDLCQDILLELVRSSGNIRDSKAFYGFMWAVAGNVYRHWCRKKARLRTCELTEDIPSEESAFDQLLAGEENSDLYLLRRELTLLSEKYRQAVILYYINRKSCSQISQSLSITESRVKYLLFKSRKILKEGMDMERKLGAHSYNPKNFLTQYYGSGPNRFYDFMQSQIRQNIADACYNDSLTPEQISLETGIPLPYLESEIDALAEKQILLKEGSRYKTNIIILTTDYADETIRDSAPYYEETAELIAEFLEKSLPDFKQIGFYGADFTDNTLRWQLTALLLRVISDFAPEQDNRSEFPLTAWGDRAFLWLLEKGNPLSQVLFSFCSQPSRQGDLITFTDYMPNRKGSQRDFYGNEYYANILCDIARGNCGNFSEYDLETVAELIKKGYVRQDKGGYAVTMPMFTPQQYTEARELVKDFVNSRLKDTLIKIDRSAMEILREHTPKHLQDQVPGIAARMRDVVVLYAPLRTLIARNVLSTDWHPLEMPTTHIQLAE